MAAPDKAGILPDGPMLAAAIAAWADEVRTGYPAGIRTGYPAGISTGYPAQFAELAARPRAAAAPQDAGTEDPAPGDPGEAP